MNNVELFNFKGNEVRTLKINDTVWFFAKDVAKSFGYARPTKSIWDNVSEHNAKTLKWRDSPKSVQSQFWNKNDFSNKTFVNEAGLYSIALNSRLPVATQFHDWVTDEVLPSINHTGSYSVQGNKQQDSYMIEDKIERAKAWITEQEQRQKLQFENNKLKPQAEFAQQISDSKDCILIGQLAKILKQNGVETGQIRLFKYLRDTNYLISRKGREYNAPTQYSVEHGLIKGREQPIKTNNGIKIRNTPLVTAKGQRFFLNKLVKKQNNDNDDSMDLF